MGRHANDDLPRVEDTDSARREALLDYPDLRSYPSDLLDTDEVLLAQRAPKRQTPKRANNSAKPRVTIVVDPDRQTHPLGSDIKVWVEISLLDDQGAWQDYSPASRDIVKVSIAGDTQQGQGPFVLPIEVAGKKTIRVDARIKGVTLVVKRTITAKCLTALPTDKTLRLVACTLFSEGGSNRNLPDEELLAIVWAIRNRVDALKNNDKRTAPKRWTFLSKRFGTRATYEAVITKPKQFTGIKTNEYWKAEKPLERITLAVECARLAKCIDVARAVVDKGTPDDPFRRLGRGNPKLVGVFYYKTRSCIDQPDPAKRCDPPTKEPPMAELTNADLHYYWGLEQEGPFR